MVIEYYVTGAESPTFSLQSNDKFKEGHGRDATGMPSVVLNVSVK